MRIEQTRRNETVRNVLLEAPVESDPAVLASRVLKLTPWGTYQTYRICYDLRRLVQAKGRFVELGHGLTASQGKHLEQLESSWKRRGLWVSGKQ